MTSDFIKEQHIKFETELLRLYFVLFLADVSGTVAFFTRENFTASRKDIFILVTGIIFACALLFFISKTKSKIKNLINHLNS